MFQSPGSGIPSLANVPLNYATRTCTLPFVCPVIRNRRGLEPILLEASHSCTQYEVMLLPSTERIVQILKQRNKLPAQYKYKKESGKITRQILKRSNSRLQSGLCLASVQARREKSQASGTRKEERVWKADVLSLLTSLAVKWRAWSQVRPCLPFSSGREPYDHVISVWNELLNKHLLIVTLTKGAWWREIKMVHYGFIQDNI